MTPQISLVIPLHNRRRYIAQAIKSVLNQTRRDFELVVWDDGSTDDSVAIATDAARGDPRVRIMRGENRGAPAAINSAANCSPRHTSAGSTATTCWPRTR